jgi:hypothetical protein
MDAGPWARLKWVGETGFSTKGWWALTGRIGLPKRGWSSSRLALKYETNLL